MKKMIPALLAGLLFFPFFAFAQQEDIFTLPQEASPEEAAAAIAKAEAAARENEDKLTPSLETASAQVDALLAQEKAKGASPLLKKYPPSVDTQGAGKEARVRISLHPKFPAEHKSEIRSVRIETVSGSFIGGRDFPPGAFESLNFQVDPAQLPGRKARVVISSSQGSWQKTVGLKPGSRAPKPQAAPPAQTDKPKKKGFWSWRS